MITFKQQQRVVEIGGVRLGGQPGKNPTVLSGSIFFRGHRIVSNPEEGIFDKNKAKELLDREAELSAQTGNPRIVDVVGETTKALTKYIEFVAANCEAPILVDSASPTVRMETIRHFANTELVRRLIYNSLDDHYTEEELACIKDCGIKSAMVLAFSTKAARPKDRVKLLKENLLGAAARAGLENLLVDTGVLDVPSVAWSAQAIWDIKENFGYPCGCAPANAVYLWKKLRARGSPAFEATAGLAFGFPICWGGDFILYGPIRNAPWVYPSCAAVDAMMAYGAMNLGVRADRTHPLYKIF